MKRQKLLFFFLVISLLMAGVFCFAQNKVTLRLAWWGNPTRDARTLQVVEMYKAKNPNVTIETETTGWAGYWDKIATQAASNSLPDIMQQDYAYINKFVQNNQLADLTPYVQSKVINLDGVADTFISGGRINNKLYGISLGTNAVCLVYDPAVLQKAGVAAPKNDWKWSNFEKMATDIYKKTNVQTNPYFTTDPRVGFDNWLRQTGASFYSADGTALGFTDEKPLVDFFDSQLRLLNAKVLIKPEVAFVQYAAEETPFSKALAWVDFVWSNQVGATQAAAKRPVGIALLPRIDTGYKRPGTYLKPSMFFSILSNSANKDEAAKFINFFINDIEANKVLLTDRGISIIPGVRKVVKDAVDPVNKQVFEYIDLVGNGNASPIDPPDPQVSGEVLALFRNTTQEVLYKQVSSKDGAKNFMKEANKILAKNKK